MTTEKHEKLYERALKAINEVFSDTSVDVSTTETSLNTLIDEISILLEALET